MDKKKQVKKTVGRPKVAGKRTKTIHLMISDEADALLREQADQENRAVAQMARILLEDAISRKCRKEAVHESD